MGVGKLSAVRAAVAATLLAGAVSADVKVGAHGGLSWPLDEGTDQLGVGFVVGAGFHLVLTPNLLVGFAVGYNRWGADEGDIIEQVEELVDGDVDGAVHMIELMPNARLVIPRLPAPFDVFGQFGVGVYIRTEQIEVVGSGPLGELIRGKPLDDTDGRLGLQAGPGVSYGFLKYFDVEVLGLYNLLFEDGPRSQYLTLQAGLNVRIPRARPTEKEKRKRR